jgi:hypothetical protein
LKIEDHIVLKQTSIYDDPVYREKRYEFPISKKPFPFNMWQILKDAVGKDLSKFCVPGITLLIKK